MTKRTRTRSHKFKVVGFILSAQPYVMASADLGTMTDQLGRMEQPGGSEGLGAGGGRGGDKGSPVT